MVRSVECKFGDVDGGRPDSPSGGWRPSPLWDAGVVLCLFFLTGSLLVLGAWVVSGSSSDALGAFGLDAVLDYSAALPNGTAGVVSADKESGGADVREMPSPDSRRLAQALLGDPVVVLEEASGWKRVALIDYQLTGWMLAERVVEPREEAASTGEVRLMIAAAPGVESPGGAFLPFGSRLPFAKSTKEGVLLRLPDGGEVEVARSKLRGADQGLNLDDALREIQAFRVCSFQEGGNSRAGLDSAGLIFLFYRSQGVAVPRDVAGLLRAGRPVPSDERLAGDVVWLSTFNPDQPPHPVLLLSGDGLYLEASPASGVALAELARRGNREILEVRRYLPPERASTP